MRRVASVASVALTSTLVVAILTACAPEAPEAPEATGYPYGVGDVREQWVKTPRGDVYCVANKIGYSGGMTCDWDHPRTAGA